MKLKDKTKYENVEIETRIYKMLQGIDINYIEMGKGDFSKEHTLYSCMIKNKENKHYQFTFQCNTKYTKPNNVLLLASLVLDARCYDDSNVGDDDDNIEEFARNFGYDNEIKRLMKAYKGCKKTSLFLNSIFNSDDLELLYNVLSENGEI